MLKISFFQERKSVTFPRFFCPRTGFSLSMTEIGSKSLSLFLGILCLISKFRKKHFSWGYLFRRWVFLKND